MPGPIYYFYSIVFHQNNSFDFYLPSFSTSKTDPNQNTIVFTLLFTYHASQLLAHFFFTLCPSYMFFLKSVFQYPLPHKKQHHSFHLKNYVHLVSLSLNSTYSTNPSFIYPSGINMTFLSHVYISLW